jgi:SAM-dependent methyltransferase
MFSPVTLDRPATGDGARAGAAAIPIPPDELVGRVGSQVGQEFVEVGRRAKEGLARALDLQRSAALARYRAWPLGTWLAHLLDPRFSFRRKRVLDFGCGAGRLLRHCLREAERYEFWGCDVHAPSIAWVEGHLVPPFRVLVNRETPPLPFSDDYFDLVVALSIFTHLTDTWEPWLVELRRIMRPGALALVTFHDGAAYEAICGAPFDEARVGMEVRRRDQGWERGGPFVFHSEWWVREHWGRVMPVEQVLRGGLDQWQSIAVLQKPLAP